MANRTTRPRAASAAGAARRLTDAMLVDLLDGTRASLGRASGQAAREFRAALAELELEAVRRGLTLPAPEEPPARVDPPQAGIPPIELALLAGSEPRLMQVLAALGPDAMHHAWQLARTIPELPMRLHRLTALCLVLDRRVFGEEVAEQRHRCYGLVPYGIEERLQLVDEAIAATFRLLGLRS